MVVQAQVNINIPVCPPCPDSSPEKLLIGENLAILSTHFKHLWYGFTSSFIVSVGHLSYGPTPFQKVFDNGQASPGPGGCGPPDGVLRLSGSLNPWSFVRSDGDQAILPGDVEWVKIRGVHLR